MTMPESTATTVAAQGPRNPLLAHESHPPPSIIEAASSLDALTDEELQALDLSADLVNALGRIIGNGPTRDGDLDEMVGHIHVIQHMIMAQAAARCYPDRFRLLGGSVVAD